VSNTIEEFMASVSDEELLVRARAAITRMCSGDRRWTMTIPPDRRDSDFVLGEVCRRLEAAKAREEAVRAAANAQAEDDGLWFMAQTAPEAYLQRALRFLHSIVEGDVAMQRLLAASVPPGEEGKP